MLILYHPLPFGLIASYFGVCEFIKFVLQPHLSRWKTQVIRMQCFWEFPWTEEKEADSYLRSLSFPYGEYHQHALSCLRVDVFFWEFLESTWICLLMLYVNCLFGAPVGRGRFLLAFHHFLGYTIKVLHLSLPALVLPVQRVHPVSKCTFSDAEKGDRGWLFAFWYLIFCFRCIPVL